MMQLHSQSLIIPGRLLMILAVFAGLIPGLVSVAFADNKLPAMSASVEGINEYILENGLRLLCCVDKSQPKVTVNCTVFVGSRHEGYGEAGMAHLLEHMLFKGTELHPNIPELLKDRGATFNGTTWLDRTNYYETLNATDDNLEFAIRLEADRLINSKILNEDLQKEFSVVRSEFEQGENNLFGVLEQRMFSAAFQWHNYRNSTIGNRSDIERVPITSLRAFYRRFYRTDNAMLIVAGKFEEKRVLELTQKYFGAIARPKTPLGQTYTVEPPQDGDRITTVRRVAETQLVGAMYHVPPGGHPEFPAVDLMATVLADQSSGRLYKSMIETRRAAAVGGGAYAFHDPGTVFFIAQVPKDKSIDDAKQTMVDTLEGIASAPFTSDEVERARRQLLNQREMESSKTDSLAVQLSDWAAQGDWRFFFLYRDGVEKATLEQVQLAAQKYLVQNNRTVGLFLPTERSERIHIPDRPNAQELVAGYRGRESISEGEQFEPTPKNIEGRLVRGDLKTGVPFAFLPKKTRGNTVNLTLNLRFGDEKSLHGKVAACKLMGKLMERGTKSLDFQKLNDRMDELKLKLNVFSTPQLLRLTLETKRDKLVEVLALVEDVLRNPAFDEQEFSILRDQFVTVLEEQKHDPSVLASLAVRRALRPYKRGDLRYVSTIEEELEDIQKLKLTDVKDIHTKYLSGTEGEVALVGDFDPAEIEPKLSAMLANWKSKVPYQRVSNSATTDVKIPIINIETLDKEDSNYVASQQYSLRDDHPKYPALLIGNAILGADPLASRLGNRVRQDEGLSYGITSDLFASPIDELAWISIEGTTNPMNRDKLIKVVDEEVRRFVKEGVTEKELKDNVQGYLQNQQLNRSNDNELASLLAVNLFTGRDMTYYEKLESTVAGLTVASVNEAISEYIEPDNFVIATAGDFAKPTQAKPKP
ncbi:MAG: pitrilysin family protein [Pirellula sp.]